MNVLRQVFARLDLPFSRTLLEWRPLPDFDIDNLDGRHSHLYARVLASTGIQPDTAPPRTLDDFPEEDGFRSNVAIHAAAYQQLLQDPERILADCDGNISKAARVLGIHRRSLQRKLGKQPPPDVA